MINRAAFLKSLFLAPLTTLKEIGEEKWVQPDNTVVVTMKRDGKTYALGYDLTGDKERDERFLGYLNNATKNTLYPPK